jgi:hypothetical protein
MSDTLYVRPAYDGERRYEVFDPEGHWWHFTRRV